MADWCIKFISQTQTLGLALITVECMVNEQEIVERLGKRLVKVNRSPSRLRKAVLANAGLQVSNETVDLEILALHFVAVLVTY